MLLVKSTSDFLVNGVPRPGFPLLLDATGRPVVIALLFLVHHCLHRGRVGSRASWKTYGEALLNYFQFLDLAGREWDEPRKIGGPSVLADYRIWLVTRRKSAATISLRITVLIAMYSFAVTERLISKAPWGVESYAKAPRNDSILGHLPRLTNDQHVDLRPRSTPSKPSALAINQVQQLIDVIRSEEHRLMIRLMLHTGLRAGELRSFPASYVVETDSSSGVHEVRLSARDMKLKNQSEGLIYITNALMSELWKYKVYVRCHRASPPASELFISRQGRAYSASFFTTLFKEASTKLGFSVHAHLLRHTYATHTLQNMRRKMNDGAALMYLRDRLRHASVRTTELYLHVWSDRADQALDEFQNDLDEMFSASR